jgi:hypothetical protein
MVGRELRFSRFARTPVSSALRAEAEFRETVAHMGKVLQGENVIEARELLREIVGTVRLDPDTDHLVAKSRALGNSAT